MPDLSVPPICIRNTTPCARQISFSRSLGESVGYMSSSSCVVRKNTSRGRRLWRDGNAMFSASAVSVTAFTMSRTVRFK